MNKKGQNVAIIGSGISGLTAAWLLGREHNVSIFEANDYLGGHTHTKQVRLGEMTYPVNTGFIVFNDRTYPNFIRLMERLGVASEPSDMSFSMRCENTGIEYSGSNLNTLFAQRRNLLRPQIWRMIADILRFNRQAQSMIRDGAIDETVTVGEFVEAYGYSPAFINYYLVPMGAAIWSSSADAMMTFPMAFFLRFFDNHGLLSVNNRPQWRVLSGGSASYIEPITAAFKEHIYLRTAVRRVERSDHDVTLITAAGDRQSFDQVVFACHSDQALAMLAQPTIEESDILGAIPYQKNDVVLHTDARLMPRNKRAWASWNYHLPQRVNASATVTYDMNRLQNFSHTSQPILVTLNRCQDIHTDKIIERYQYSHPVFTLDGMRAQQRHAEISGKNNSHYCGAYWFNGFHEDGVNSGLRVAQAFGVQW